MPDPYAEAITRLDAAMQEADVEEIYNLRAVINALWDVVWDLAGNGGDDLDDVLKLYAKRVEVHRTTRRPNA
jgi:hypothetical protein